jgi:hypothetical protein
LRLTGCVMVDDIPAKILTILYPGGWRLIALLVQHGSVITNVPLYRFVACSSK